MTATFNKLNMPTCTIKTNKAIGETIKLLVSANYEDYENIWIDLNNDGNCEKITKINTYKNYNIGSKEITIYGNITALGCSGNQLTTIDVSKNANLIYLDCEGNQLTILDISNNIRLTYLSCSKNKITYLDTDKNIELTTLWCNCNSLTYLNINKNINLITLHCQCNQLKVLNVINNVNLFKLSCFNNNISEAAMTSLVNSLNTRSKADNGELYVYNATASPSDANKCTKSDVSIAKGKNWKVFYATTKDLRDYKNYTGM